MRISDWSSDVCSSDLRFDASALDAALVELVANARTALATGGRIIVRAKRAGRRLWVTVADTGKGMSQQEGKFRCMCAVGGVEMRSVVSQQGATPDRKSTRLNSSH